MNREAWVTGAVFANEVSHVDKSSAARLGSARSRAARRGAVAGESGRRVGTRGRPCSP